MSIPLVCLFVGSIEALSKPLLYLPSLSFTLRSSESASGYPLPLSPRGCRY